jgi:hypothetical protein
LAAAITSRSVRSTGNVGIDTRSDAVVSGMNSGVSPPELLGSTV